MSHCTNEIDCCTGNLFAYDSTVSDAVEEDSEESVSLSPSGNPICQGCGDSPSDCGDFPPATLIAEFTFTPETGDAALDVQFTDTSIGTPTLWFWDFGDGNTSTDQNPQHTFTEPGTYSITLTVQDASSNEDDVTHSITITNPYISPPDPPDVPDLATWLKADAGVYEDAAGTNPAEDGDTVKRWNDQSGAGIDLTNSNGTPIFRTGIQNGLPVIRTNATTDFFGDVTVEDALYVTGAGIVQPVSIVMVIAFKSDALWLDSNKRGSISHEGALGIQIIRKGDGSLYAGQINTSTGAEGQNVSGGMMNIDEFYILSIVLDGANSSIRINNGTKITGDCGSGNFSNFILGSRTTLSTHFGVPIANVVNGICDFAEIARYDRAAYEFELAALREYLAVKWGITI